MSTALAAGQQSLVGSCLVLSGVRVIHTYNTYTLCMYAYTLCMYRQAKGHMEVTRSAIDNFDNESIVKRFVPSVAEWSKAPESDASAGGGSPVRASVLAATLCPYA